MTPAPIAVSCGEPAGVGPEIIVGARDVIAVPIPV